MMRALCMAAAIVVQPLVTDDVLEPSVRNEVNHALSRAPTNAPPVAPAVLELQASRVLLSTNGCSLTELAIRLVSVQNGDGRWFVGTNDVTAAALGLLRSM